MGEAALIIPLDGVVGNGDCQYFVSLIDATSRAAAPFELFKLESPTFIKASSSGLTNRVSVKEQGFITVQTNQVEQAKNYKLAL